MHIRRYSLLLRILLIVLLWADRCAAVKWLALFRSKQKSWSHNRNCSKAIGLVPKQAKLCRSNMDLMQTVTHSAIQTIDTCQEQFSDRRWNCSSVRNSPHLSRDLARGTREQAFVYALASSSLVHSVARACTLGVTTKCSCGALPSKPPSGDYKWGGCGDDVIFALRFTQAFIDSSLQSKGKPKASKKATMNRHNNAAGRMVVAQGLENTCKCHGVSGSCSIKTCWKALPDFDTIATTLKNRYALAVEVKRKRRKYEKVFVPINPSIENIRQDQLIYYAKSPDYCSPYPKTGSVGTHGRLCDKTSTDSGGCGSMCCGRGYKNFMMEVVERCECKYYWCCYVKCKTCRKTLELSRCI